MSTRKPIGPSGTVSSRLIQRGLDFARRLGCDTIDLCREFGLDPSWLADPEARIANAAAAELTERVIELTDDQNFGLHLARDVERTTTFDAAGLLLMASPNVRTALQRMIAHQRYWNDARRSSWIARPDGAAIRYQTPHATGTSSRHAAECMLAEIALGVRVLTGTTLNPRRVSFQHESPASTLEHAQLFGCSIEFRAAHTEIEFDDRTLDATLQHAHATF
ncbi:MAG TPA: AraC family transcriptional regulator, partial [Polyangiales bacterium]